MQLLPRLRLHLMLDERGAYGVVQEVIPIPGGLLRLYRYRDGDGGVMANVLIDPRVEEVAARLAQMRRSGLARRAA